jgi:S-DNA-T family DNA segregation ATPase FtsK/SpoIIIE
LRATGFTLGDVLLVAGPPQSGKTTTLATLITSISRVRPDTLLYYFGNRRSLLPSSLPWTRAATTPEDIADLAGDIARVLEKDPAAPGTLAVVVEGVADFLNSKADQPLQELIKACRNCEQTVIAEGETTGLTGSWPLLQAVKASRHGLVLQPDQGDGDLLFRTSFPRSNRSDFPPGRGNYVRSGRVVRVQVALPE